MTVIKSYLSIIIMGVFVVVSGATLMIVSQNVYESQSRIQTMNQKTLSAEWEIRSLNGELAFLTRPDRLEQITTALSQSISPSIGSDIMVVSPVSLMSYDQQSYGIIPNRKPSASPSPTRVSAPIPQTDNTQIKATKSASNDFSSLINSIGGDE